MISIGLTGGIGSGKSEAARVLRGLGAVVIDTAKLGHEAYRRGAPCFDEVVREFGQGITGPDGEIDRKQLGAIVFAEPARRKRLEEIVWPRIAEALGEKLAEARRDRAEVAVIDSAMLLEAGWDAFTDEVWMVEAPEDQVVARVVRRSGLTEEQVRQRIAAQMPNTERRARAKLIIWNDSDLATLGQRVTAAWRAKVEKSKRG